MIYIYKMINEATGQYYIGKHKCNARNKNCRNHSNSLDGCAYRGSGLYLRRLYKAHPEHIWRKEIITTCETEAEAFQIEKDTIGTLWGSDPLCLNLIEGGCGMTSEVSKNLWSTGKCGSDNYRENVSRGVKKAWEDNREYMLSCTQSENAIALRAEAMRKKWKDADNKEKWVRSLKEAQALPEYKSKVIKPVKIKKDGSIFEVSREELINYLNDGYDLAASCVSINNGMVCIHAINNSTAKDMIINKGWQYGKNRSLPQVTLRQHLDSTKDI